MKLKDLKISYQKGKPPKVKEGDFLLPYLTPDYIRKGAIPEFYPTQLGVVLVEDGELLLLWDGSNAGEFLKGKRGILASTMVKFDKIEGADDTYIFYSLKLQEPSLKAKTSGSGIPHVDKEALNNLNIFLPEKRHQNCITDILTTIDQTIEKTEQLIAKNERIKTGLMQDLLTRGIDENGHIRTEGVHEFKDSPLGRIPKEWEVIKLKNCIHKDTIITYGIVQTGEHQPEGVRVLRTVDLSEFGIKESNLLRTSEAISNQFKRTILREGDIVCNVRASVGDFNIVPESLAGINTTRGVARISVDKDIVDNYYLLWFLKSYRNEKQMELLIKGTTFIDINIADLRELNVLMPKNRKEQENISKSLGMIEKTLETEKGQLYKFQKLKTSLMQDLLTGKVRVDSLIEKA